MARQHDLGSNHFNVIDRLAGHGLQYCERCIIVPMNDEDLTTPSGRRRTAIIRAYGRNVQFLSQERQGIIEQL
jgi:hypothetical protein